MHLLQQAVLILCFRAWQQKLPKWAMTQIILISKVTTETSTVLSLLNVFEIFEKTKRCDREKKNSENSSTFQNILELTFSQFPKNLSFCVLQFLRRLVRLHWYCIFLENET